MLDIREDCEEYIRVRELERRVFVAVRAGQRLPYQLWIMPFMSGQWRRTEVEVIELGYTVLLDQLHYHSLVQQTHTRIALREPLEVLWDSCRKYLYTYPWRCEQNA